MAVLLLASTTSWTVGKHYCMGRLMNVALFEHAEDCGMDMEGLSLSEELESCCKDELLVIDGQDDLKLSFSDLTIDQQEFLVAFSQLYLDLFNDIPEQVVPDFLYPPPLLVKDIQLLDEVFLI